MENTNHVPNHQPVIIISDELRIYLFGDYRSWSDHGYSISLHGSQRCGLGSRFSRLTTFVKSKKGRQVHSKTNSPWYPGGIYTLLWKSSPHLRHPLPIGWPLWSPHRTSPSWDSSAPPNTTQRSTGRSSGPKNLKNEKKTGDTKSAPNERFTHWSMRFLGIVITNDPMNPMINDVIFVGWDSYEDMFFSWESMTKN